MRGSDPGCIPLPKIATYLTTVVPSSTTLIRPVFGVGPGVAEIEPNISPVLVSRQVGRRIFVGKLPHDMGIGIWTTFGCRVEARARHAGRHVVGVGGTDRNAVVLVGLRDVERDVAIAALAHRRDGDRAPLPGVRRWRPGVIGIDEHVVDDRLAIDHPAMLGAVQIDQIDHAQHLHRGNDAEDFATRAAIVRSPPRALTSLDLICPLARVEAVELAVVRPHEQNVTPIFVLESEASIALGRERGIVTGCGLTGIDIDLYAVRVYVGRQVLEAARSPRRPSA